MTDLLPCPTCNRHVRTDERCCPFCAAALPALGEEPRGAPAVRGRMSRALLFATGAALMGAGACRHAYGGPPLPELDASPPVVPPRQTPNDAPISIYGGPPPPLFGVPPPPPRPILDPAPERKDDAPGTSSTSHPKRKHKARTRR